MQSINRIVGSLAVIASFTGGLASSSAQYPSDYGNHGSCSQGGSCSHSNQGHAPQSLYGPPPSVSRFGDTGGRYRNFRPAYGSSYTSPASPSPRAYSRPYQQPYPRDSFQPRFSGYRQSGPQYTPNYPSTGGSCQDGECQHRQPSQAFQPDSERYSTGRYPQRRPAFRDTAPDRYPRQGSPISQFRQPFGSQFDRRQLDHSQPDHPASYRSQFDSQRNYQRNRPDFADTPPQFRSPPAFPSPLQNFEGSRWASQSPSRPRASRQDPVPLFPPSALQPSPTSTSQQHSDCSGCNHNH